MDQQNKLVFEERAALDHYETVIAQGLKTFYEVGEALLAIRDRRLYRSDFATFEEYCRERWSMRRRWADRLIEAAGVIDNLSPIGLKPTNEWQTRELAPYTAEEQREIWHAAIATAPANGKGEPVITAAHIREVASTKSAPHVSNNSGENEWYTPPEIIEAARVVLGGIDVDPCSSEVANKWIRARRFFTMADSGLTKKWRGRVWMNPPYSSELVTRFVAYLVQEAQAGRTTAAITLTNNATETVWFSNLVAISSANRVMAHAEDGLITVDYKCCVRSQETGNLFIETVSNDRTRRAGWANTSKADFLLYFVVPESVFVFSMRWLREFSLPVWSRWYLPRAAVNSRYNTLGLCVPFESARAEAEYVARLNFGDGLILQISERHAGILLALPAEVPGK